MKRPILAMLALGAALASAPGHADVKAGVDAWGRGEYKKAVEEWRGPAVAGDADAQFNLGQAYKLGRGVPVDTGLAEQWYGRAAQQGHAQAEENYGLALFQNNKREQATPWLQKAASRGEARAQFVLGTMYFNGDAVKKDWVRAYALITRASQSGLPQASQSLAQMDRYISLADRRDGLELARKYEEEARRPQVASTTPRPAPLPTPASRSTATRPVETATVAAASAAQGDVPLLDSVSEAPASPARPVAAPVRTAATPSRATAPAASGAWRVQLGAFGEPGNAQRLWTQMSARFPGRQPYYVKSGKLTRLLVGPFASGSEATRACAAVKPCVPVRS